jgi:hypothetical protein
MLQKQSDNMNLIDSEDEPMPVDDSTPRRKRIKA